MQNHKVKLNAVANDNMTFISRNMDQKSGSKIKVEKEKMMNPKSEGFKILSLDGGGIKGLYAAKLLAQIEEKTGHLIGEYFDMICGTSTGGLLALGITNKVPCKEIARFYVEHGPLIFPYENRLKRGWRGLKQIALGTKYENKMLKSAITELIGDTKTMKDADHILCIPAFNVTKGRPTVFKKPFGRYHRDGRFTMLDVALATSAAPTFLPAVPIESDQYVDGGIYANNPCLIGFTEAIDHFIGQTYNVDNETLRYDRLSLLSIGLPNNPIGEVPEIPTRRSYLKWGGKLMSSAMTGVSYIAAYQANKLTQAMEGSSYYRLEPPQLSSTQLKHVEMDNSSRKAIQILMTYGQDLGDDFTSSRWHEIESYFNNFKSYKI